MSKRSPQHLVSKHSPHHAVQRKKLFTRAATSLVAVIVAGLVIAASSNAGVSASDSRLVSIYPATTVPTTPAEDDPHAVELGVRFSVRVPGSVVGIKYYKSWQNRGTHAGSLWTSNGARLASATFNDETRFGWQKINFAKPVALTPGATYVASYHTDTGYYAQQQWAFSSGATLGNRTITASSGLYAYGQGGFPTEAWHKAAYYVDVLFLPGPANGSLGSTPRPTTAPAQSTSASTSSSQPKPSRAATVTTAPASSVSPTHSAPAPSSTLPTSPQPSSSTSAPPAPTGSFPGPTNTGVPAGTNLTVHSGDLTITQAGYVLHNMQVEGCITVKARADNVTIKNVLVKGGGCYWPIQDNSGAKGLSITDVEVDGQNNPSNDAGIACDNGCTVTRANIHNTIDGMKVGNTTVQDSYIHDLDHTSTSHNDGIQSLGAIGLNIRHNTVTVSDDATSAVILSTGVATDMRNISIDSNLLGGGQYTVYGGYAAGVDQLSKISNISVTNNKFTTQICPKSGVYGPLTSVDPPVAVSGNTWADGPKAGQPVTR